MVPSRLFASTAAPSRAALVTLDGITATSDARVTRRGESTWFDQ
jgi:hypothetical protein